MHVTERIESVPSSIEPRRQYPIDRFLTANSSGRESEIQDLSKLVILLLYINYNSTKDFFRQNYQSECSNLNGFDMVEDQRFNIITSGVWRSN